MRVGILVTHPIQYYAPWYRALARAVDLTVFFCHRQSAADHGRTEFGLAFEWDLPLLDGYRSHFLPNRARRPDVSHWSGCDTPEIARLIREGRFDAFIVQGWYVRSYWQAISACWRYGTPLLIRGDSHLITPRSPLLRLLKRLVYGAFIPRFSAYLVVGERNRAYYSHYGADPLRMFFAPHAVDNQFFREHALQADRQRLRAAWGIPPGAVVALFAGKLAPHKRSEDMVRAVAAAARHTPGLWGLIVGDGPLRPALEDLARELAAPIHFAGFLNQSMMPAAYAVSDLLVLPSDETWGLVVNEAMAAGLPALVSDHVGCAPDLILPGQTGACYPHGDLARLADLLATLAADPSRLRALGRNAALHIGNYSIERTTAGTLAALSVVRSP